MTDLIDPLQSSPLPGDTLDPEEARYLDILNAFRADLGLATVQADATLTMAANRHALDIQYNIGFQTHDWSFGSFGDGVRALGGVGSLSENIYIHPDRPGFHPDAVFAQQAWLDSTGHRNAMERADWQSVGIAWQESGAVVIFSDAPAAAPPEVSQSVPYTIRGGAGDDLLLHGTVGNDLMLGLDGRDRLPGGDGHDRLDGGAGDDTLDGGAGIDTVLLAHPRDAYTLVMGADGSGRISGPEGTDTLRGIERIQFSDGRIAYDEDAAAVYRLYQAALGRTPDGAGLAYWLDRQLDGVALAAMADAFIASPEFISRFGDTLPDSAFIDRLYENVLGRLPDADGAAHWRDSLDNGAARRDVVLSFTDSAENITRTAAAIDDGIWYV